MDSTKLMKGVEHVQCQKKITESPAEEIPTRSEDNTHNTTKNIKTVRIYVEMRLKYPIGTHSNFMW